MPRLTGPDPDGLPEVLTRAQAREAGLSDGQINWLVTSGRWTRLGPGTYVRTWQVDRPVTAHAANRLLHIQRCAAATSRRGNSVVGLTSAAMVHDLPLVHYEPPMLELLVPAIGRREVRGQVRTRLAHLADADVVLSEVAGLGPMPVTSVARTWVDIARTQPLADVLSTGDAALRRGLMTPDQAMAVLERLGPARGVRRASRALPLLDARRESALESGSAAHFIEWDFPPPQLQHCFYDADGLLICISDFDWPDHGVAGFAGGMTKYGLNPGRDRAERRQESRLRPQAIVARWGWPETAGLGRPLFTLLAPLLSFTGPMRVSPLWLP